jgi:energy-coupling factor transport system substrate-specific component
MLLSLLLIRLVSGAVLAGLLGKAIGDGLAATGALSTFPLGREAAQKKVKAAE